MIVMPGFVDTHRHVWQTPVRGVLPCCTLDNYFAVMLGSVGGHYRPEDVYIGDYAGSLEALNGGVTTILDWSHISNTPDHSDAAVQGLRDAGIRAVYAHGVPTGGEWWSFSDLDHPEDVRRIRETYFSSDDQLLTLALAARAPGELELRGRQARLGARARPRDPHQRPRRHAAVRRARESRQEHRRPGAPRSRHDVHPLHRLDGRGARPDRRVGWHARRSLPTWRCSWATAIRRPASCSPRGVRPSLSVDVVSSVPGEMFTQMRTALVQERIGHFTDTPDEPFAPTLVLPGRPRVRDDRRRAAPAGWRTRSARSTPGKQADIVLLQTNAINTAPMIDPIGTIVVFSDTSNVDSVFVAGRAVKRGGELVDVDLTRTFAQLDESRDAILSKGGLLPEWADQPTAAA